jgi:hypothetical protein
VIFDVQLGYKYSHMLHNNRVCELTTTNMAVVRSFVVIHIDGTFNVNRMCTEVITCIKINTVINKRVEADVHRM